VDEQILERLDVCARPVNQGGPDRGGDEDLEENTYRDEWGVTRTRPPGCVYYDMTRSLSPATSPRRRSPAIAGRIRPTPDATGLREKALQLRQETGFASCITPVIIWYTRPSIYGASRTGTMDLGANQDLFKCLMDAVIELLIEMNRGPLRGVGDLIDVIAFGDDIGLQGPASLLPGSLRKMIRPYQERIVEAIRSQTPAKIL